MSKNINTKALQEAIQEHSDERLQKDLRDWLVYTAPHEVQDIWKRYIEKVEENDKQVEKLRESYARKQDEAVWYLQLVAYAVFTGVVCFCSYQLYEMFTVVQGCPK